MRVRLLREVGGVRHWRILAGVLEFRETHLFTRQITSLLTDDEYARLQGVLVVDPAAGDLIPGAAGLRKLRWMMRLIAEEFR